MNALATVTFAPAVVALFRGSRFYWWLLLASVMSFLAFLTGSPGTAATLWLAALVIACL